MVTVSEFKELPFAVILVAVSRRARRGPAGPSGLASRKTGEKVGMSARVIQNVEAGDNFPGLPDLARLRAALRGDWSELFSGCDKG